MIWAMSDHNWRAVFFAHMAMTNDWNPIADYSSAVECGIVWG